MKHIWICDNGEVEFDSQEDLERYFSGEKPILELKDGTKYKATYEKSNPNKIVEAIKNGTSE